MRSLIKSLIRWCLFAVALSSVGCAADKEQWDAFWKDLRGDNMQMRGFSDTKPNN